jgi:galactokinase
MTGGGFGGCTVNLVATQAVDRFCERVADRYRERIGGIPDVYVCSASQGADACPL